jgi:hypothetical protein
MAQRKPFLLRLDPATHEALQSWADSELRSLNGQIEYLLRKALREAGRLPSKEGEGGSGNESLSKQKFGVKEE